MSAIDAAANESDASSGWSGAASDGALLTTYAYDAESRLTQIETGSETLGTYAYDGAGDRVAKTTAAGTTAYTLDLASSLPQVLSETTGADTTAYAYGGGPLEFDRSGTTYWYLADTLGSVRLLTDSAGDTPATYSYSAFGSTRSETGALTNEVRFTGERTDSESGLEFLRARTYDPSTGTFLQRDSWGITPTSSQSIDAYVYTADNPVNAIDPSGHVTLNCRYGRDDCDSLPRSIKAAMPPMYTTAAATSSSGSGTSMPGGEKADSNPPASSLCVVTAGTLDCTNNSTFDQLVSQVPTADQAAQAATDAAWGQGWKLYYQQTIGTLLRRYPTMSASQARQIAYNLAKMNIAKGGGEFLRSLSTKPGVAGAVSDALLTLKDCQKGIGPCLLKSGLHFGGAMAGVGIGTAVVTACIGFSFGGPVSCGIAGLVAGGATALGLDTVSDAALDSIFPDTPQATPDPHP